MQLTLALFMTGALTISAQILPRPSSIQQGAPYEPITAQGRGEWVLRTYRPESLLVSGPISSAFRTLRNSPEEWGPGWEGFGKRYGIRLVNNSIMNGVEAATGSIWGEDPRYQRLGQGPIKRRVLTAVKQSYMTAYRDGKLRFGAARFIGITSGSFLQNTYMPKSSSDTESAMIRIGTSYLGRVTGNMFREFGPDLKRLIRHR